MSSCAVSCCTYFPKASFVSGTSASLLAGAAPLCFRFVGGRSLRYRDRTPNRKHPSREQACPLWLSPNCGAPMIVVERLTTAQIQLRCPPIRLTAAASLRSFHTEEPACFATPTPRVPRQPTHPFFPLLPTRPVRPFCRFALFPARTPSPSSSSPRPTALALHSISIVARVRRASGF